MTAYNVIYTPGTDVVKFQKALAKIGASINVLLPNLCVVNISIEDTTKLTTISGVVGFEEDVTLLATAHIDDWARRRTIKETLPISNEYKAENYGLGSTVYVVDSGITDNHPELVTAVAETRLVKLYSFNDDFSDTTGHGTILTGLILSPTIGVSKDATVKIVKIPMGVSIPVLEILRAFEAILTDSKATPDVKVVLCSWTIPKSSVLDTKITELESAGLIVVAAAGNTGSDAEALSPVGLDSVLGVGASDAYDRTIAWGSGQSSNWGPDVDITAPGISVTVCNPNGMFVQGSGTSLSAAIVAGIAAQYITKYGGAQMTSLQIQDIILNLAAQQQLFRNENIYGTTPNSLVQAVRVDMLAAWDINPAKLIYPTQKGTSTTITINYFAPLVKAEYITFTTPNGKVFYTLNWITASDNGSAITLTVTPPTTVATGHYLVNLIGTTATGDKYIVNIFCGVYTTDVSELTPTVKEMYMAANTLNTIVTAAVGCTSNKDCPKGYPCLAACHCCAT